MLLLAGLVRALVLQRPGDIGWREKQRARCKVSLFHTATVSEHTALIDDRETWSNAQSSDRLD
jgi:hypothetical protein